MSDLSSVAAFRRTSPQLPVQWYFDPGIHAVEQRLLFDHGPGYAGHELMVPNAGDYHALAWRGNPPAPGGDARDGGRLGAPHFADNPCLDLARTPLQRWNGLLFAGGRDVARDLANVGHMKDLDFSGYLLDRVEVDEYACNWKTFIEVYLEDYHVEPFHPALGQFVNVSDLQWEFGDWYSVQTCGIKNALARPGSPVYRRWHEQVLRYDGDRQPAHGAIWLTYFPNIMVEWYPHVLVVSTIIPRGPEACSNVVEFYYPEDIALFEREFVEAEQAAYRETAVEDDEIALRLDRGRKALMH